MSRHAYRLAKLEHARLSPGAAQKVVYVADDESEEQALERHARETGYEGPVIVGAHMLSEDDWEAACAAGRYDSG